MSETLYQADVIVVGAGIAGIVTTLELLSHGKSVVLLDRDIPERFGGLAKESFGGMFFVDSPHQRRAGIQDSVDLALSDWLATARFGTDDHWPRKWAEKYVHECTPHIYHWLRKQEVSFFRVINWVERGLFHPGNSVPRFHMVWGTGYGLTMSLIAKLEAHPNVQRMQRYFRHRVTELLVENQAVVGVRGTNEATGAEFIAKGECVVIASGGINGSIEKVKANWYKAWGEPPETILNGSHQYALGDLHEATERINGNVTHLDWQWNYAAGVHHPQPKRPNHGLSLVPVKSGLWMNYRGERIGPIPLVTAYDTRYMVERICQEPVKYSWQVLNLKIAYKEFAISGSEHNEAIREKKLFQFIKTVLFGNKKLVHQMLDTCEDFVTANSVEELAEKMNALSGEQHVDAQRMRQEIAAYDAQIDRGRRYHNDEQLRRIAHLRQYRGDRVRTCKFQKIMDPTALPLIGIRAFILSRKSTGGIQTDLQARVLSKPHNGQQHPIEGLYAVGESTGFGGGGMHGLGALEGTFLGGCVLTARTAAHAIVGKSL
ncbi:MAG: FAD-binding dehydrogenase [Bacteroidetes bacterium]|nr:MAG: FAD-binding dehydrogenase [Bacteroidota bacterium]